DRFQTAHDVKVELRWLAEGGSQTGAATAQRVPRAKVWQYAGWLVAIVLLAIAGWAWWRAANQTQRAMYFESPVRSPANYVALSPDGSTVTMVAYSDQANKYMLWSYEIGSRKAAIIPGTEDASHPFWSPDGRSIGFFADGKLKRVDISGGRSPQVICDAPNGRGGTWNRDGTIVFAPDVWVGLHRVPSSGGTPVEITKPDPSRFEQSHRWPMFLPDGKHFLYLASNFSGHFEKDAIYVGMLDSSEKKFITNDASNAAYSGSGYLLYARDNKLVAQKFDPDRFTLSGEPQTLSDEIQLFSGIDLAPYSIAGGETLVLQTGKAADRSQLIWFDRAGKQLGVAGMPALLANPNLSPDGRRVAFEQTDRDGRHLDVWVSDLGNDATMRLTFGPQLSQMPVWSPDGKQLAYSANRNLKGTLRLKNADGSGAEQQFGEASNFLQAFCDWSRGGKYLLIQRHGELWYFSAVDQQTKPVFRDNWLVRNAQFSPDSKWI